MICKPEQLGQWQQWVGTVVEDQAENSEAVEVKDPEDAEEADSNNVVNKHFTEVLSLCVEQLHEGHGPIEGQLQHVVPPHLRLNHMKWITLPAELDGGHPGLVQHTDDPEHQQQGVRNKAENVRSLVSAYLD